MPRKRNVVEQLEEKMAQDPAPVKRGPGRPRKAATTAVASRAAGRPRTAARAADGRMMSKTAMVEKVSAEIYMYASLAVAAWEWKDPDCAEVMYETARIPGPSGIVEVQRLEGICQRLTAIIARNDKLLKLAAESGIIGDVLTMVALAFPIARTVWSNHGPNGAGHDQTGVNDAQLAAQYPAYPGPGIG